MPTENKNLRVGDRARLSEEGCAEAREEAIFDWIEIKEKNIKGTICDATDCEDSVVVEWDNGNKDICHKDYLEKVPEESEKKYKSCDAPIGQFCKKHQLVHNTNTDSRTDFYTKEERETLGYEGIEAEED